jgi:carbamoyl-phosphate synthase large subunit
MSRNLGNILVTSAGRRVSLVRNLRESLHRFNSRGKVYTIDLNPELSSACQASDGFEKAPRVTDGGYLDFLKEFSERNGITLIIPTIDTELSLLASVKDSFREMGVEIAISSLNVCETFYLKSTTERFFSENGFRTPQQIDPLKTDRFPLFAKLNNGSCSVGVEMVYEKSRAVELQKENPLYIFQEFIDGTEFTVDVFVGRDGEVKSVVPRQRIEVRAGEVSKAKTVKDRAIIDEVKRIFTTNSGFYGTITVQLFKREDELIFIEVNPRFGGGYPLSQKAGADYCELLIKDYMGEKLSYSEEWEDSLIMLRYDSEIIVKG